MHSLQLDNLRNVLIRQEETIIFALIERAQFKQNRIIYQKNGIAIQDFDGSFCDYLLFETEKIHARVRRYTSPDEHPFSPSLPAPILPPMNYSRTICPNDVNINDRIYRLYVDQIIPNICAAGDDNNYGSSVTCDVICLQSLSKRIHYGKFVAEAKFQQAPAAFADLIKRRDEEGLRREITHPAVEERLLRRVEQKAATYGQEIDENSNGATYKIQPAAIRRLYQEWIVPLTKTVEIQYLLQRESTTTIEEPSTSSKETPHG